MCSNNNCISGSKLCDGNNDCSDNSDETTICTGSGSNEPFSFGKIRLDIKCQITFLVLISNNPSPLGAICSESNFVCQNKKRVPSVFVCNGKNDCGDNSDEDLVNCTGKLISE